jgi:AcrR family transcriptional regulator
MTTLSRKQQEIAQREEEILNRARSMLLSDGYRDLTIDRLASDLAVSKGTVYNHFANKEDIVLALATRAMQARLALFSTAAASATVHRHRLVAIGAAAEHFCDHLREHFRVEMWIRNIHIWEKSSDSFQLLIKQCEQSIMGVVGGIVHDAIAAKEIKADNMSPAEIVFGFWALVHGGQLIAATSPSLQNVGIENTHLVIRRHCHNLMEAMQWKPLLKFRQQNQMMDKFRSQLLSFRL